MPNKTLIINKIITKITYLNILIIFIGCSKYTNQGIIKSIHLKQSIINEITKKIDINPILYSCVIYGELKNNLNYLDEYDLIRAKIGSDPSVGFAQIKISTFRWIENIYANKDILEISKSKDELICKITNDTLNILYSALYIKLIISSYYKIYKIYPSISVIASYYSYGIDYGKKIFSPNYVNKVGRTAEIAYKMNLFSNKN